MEWGASRGIRGRGCDSKQTQREHPNLFLLWESFPRRDAQRFCGNLGVIRVECLWAWANKAALAGSLVHFVLLSEVCERGDLGRQGCLLPSCRFLKVA